jgi:enamine deaminase RidA (YjgF/YER057c/UK114 family)
MWNWPKMWILPVFGLEFFDFSVAYFWIARSTVQVVLYDGFKVEIEAIAIIPS